MRQYPLYELHPQFSVDESHGYYEYRLENWHLSRDGSGTAVRGTSTLTYRATALIMLLNAYFWSRVASSPWGFCGAAAVLLIYLFKKCSQVLYESVVIVPPHGIQIETHRGYPGLHLFATRRFIRLEILQDVIIHEGLKGWNVRYYLAAVKATKSGMFTLEPAFKNLLPQQTVLIYVYRGIHNRLFRREDIS